MKKKLDDLTKVKLIYSGELVVIAIVVLVIAILELCQVMYVGETFRNIFNWVTIFGGSYIIFDCIWNFVSKKKRSKNSLFDKLTLFPLGLYLVSIDIYFFINYGTLDQSIYQLLIPIALLAVSLIYLAQGIYHWFYPLPSLLKELEQERIDKITYKVIERNETEIIALHIDSNKKYSFPLDIKENVDELFCLDQYPNIEYKEINE